MVRIERIDQSNRLYPQARTLRQAVLFDPIGFDFDRFAREYPGLEDRFEHFVAVVDHPTGERVIGTACLLRGQGDDARIGKLMQMAVDPQRQGEGIGRRLVVAVEERAFGVMGMEELYCHAQTSAVGFYERLGWGVVGDEFVEAGIPHRRMAIRAGGVAAEDPLGEPGGV